MGRSRLLGSLERRTPSVALPTDRGLASRYRTGTSGSTRRRPAAAVTTPLPNNYRRAGGLPVLCQHDGLPVGDSVLRVVVAVSGTWAGHHSDGDTCLGQSVKSAGLCGGTAADRFAFEQDTNRRTAALGGDKSVGDPCRRERVPGQNTRSPRPTGRIGPAEASGARTRGPRRRQP